MDRLQQKSTKIKSKDQDKSKIEFVIGSAVALLIAITPFLFDIYKYVPEVKIWDTFLFTYDSKYYGDASTVVWTLLNKLVPLFLMFIWFFTNRHWWYHALLVPISMYIYQIMLTLNSDLYFMDENQVLYLLPVMAIIIPSIYLIRTKAFNKINDADKTLEELEKEFMIKPKTIWGKVKQYF